MNQVLSSATLKEVSKKLNITSKECQKWSELLDNVVTFPSSKNKERRYSNLEVECLQKIGEMREKGLKDEIIIGLMQIYLKDKIKHLNSYNKNKKLENETISGTLHHILNEFEHMSSSIQNYKTEITNDIKEEIRNNLTKEVIYEIKKELISHSSSQESFLNVQMDQVNDSILALKGAVDGERSEYRKMIDEERQINRQDIASREEVFVNFVQSYREAAIAKSENNIFKRLFSTLNYKKMIDRTNQ